MRRITERTPVSVSDAISQLRDEVERINRIRVEHAEEAGRVAEELARLTKAHGSTLETDELDHNARRIQQLCESLSHAFGAAVIGCEFDQSILQDLNTLYLGFRGTASEYKRQYQRRVAQDEEELERQRRAEAYVARERFEKQLRQRQRAGEYVNVEQERKAFQEQEATGL